MNYSFYIEEIKKTLSQNKIDYNKIIIDLGQVTASEKRDKKESFLFKDHLRGFILALLSKQRTWGPIAQNLLKIEEIFGGYDYQFLLKIESRVIIDKIKEIKCGNRSINSQMDSLKINIETLLNIKNQFGSLDLFVESDKPKHIATLISDNKSKYKLKGLGFTLALEYLRNVGVKAIKPDVHVRRLISRNRLGWFSYIPSEHEVVTLLNQIGNDIALNETYLDNLLWIFCAKNYGDICGSNPKCYICTLEKVCSYEKFNNRNQ